MYLVEVWKSVEPDSSGVDHRDAARARFMWMLKVDDRPVSYTHLTLPTK